MACSRLHWPEIMLLWAVWNRLPVICADTGRKAKKTREHNKLLLFSPG